MLSVLGLPLWYNVSSSIDDVLDGVVLNPKVKNWSHDEETAAEKKGKGRSELGLEFDLGDEERRRLTRRELPKKTQGSSCKGS